MVKQMELLKSFNLAQDKDQAYGVIAALKEGRELPTAKTPQQALEGAVQTGNKMIERQTDISNKMLNELIKINNNSGEG